MVRVFPPKTVCHQCEGTAELVLMTWIANAVMMVVLANDPFGMGWLIFRNWRTLRCFLLIESWGYWPTGEFLWEADWCPNYPMWTVSSSKEKKALE